MFQDGRYKTMAYRALIPVKVLHEAKSRLADYVPSEQREQLVIDMLHHVITVLQDSEQFEQVAVVSADPRVLNLAQRWGALPRIEEAQGHNAELHAAALREIASGATALLTMSADLPLLTVDDIRRLIEAAQHYDVVLAPSHEGTGTNALLVHPPLALPYLFGVNSLERYLTEARQRGMNSTQCISHGLSQDIDTIDDLEQFHRYQQEDKMALAAYLF